MTEKLILEFRQTPKEMIDLLSPKMKLEAWNVLNKKLATKERKTYHKIFASILFGFSGYLTKVLWKPGATITTMNKK